LVGLTLENNMRNEKGQFVKGNEPRNKGVVGVFHHSIETRKSISEGLIGFKRPPRTLEHRTKISIARKGVATNTGKRWKLSLQARENISKGHRGSKSYSWKGGVTPLMRQIRRCFLYREWRKAVFERDKYTCQKCGEKGGWKEADHYPKSFAEIFYSNNIKTLDEALECVFFWDTNNGRTLCRECHFKTPTYGFSKPKVLCQ